MIVVAAVDAAAETPSEEILVPSDIAFSASVASGAEKENIFAGETPKGCERKQRRLAPLEQL